MIDLSKKHPLDVVKVGDVVEVRILEVDEKEKEYHNLSMKKIIKRVSFT